MDELVGAVAQSFAHAGPAWGFLLLVTALSFTKLVPMLSEHIARSEQREDRREERKARESEERDRQAVEQAKLAGQWYAAYDRATTVQEQTNQILKGLDARLAAFELSLTESKDRSHAMAQEVHEIHGRVVRPEKED